MAGILESRGELAMDVQRQIGYWLNGSQEDVEAASVLLEKRKISQGLFFAHLAVEKVLKAHVTKATGQVPPRTHDLLRLADLADIAMSRDCRAFLARLQRHCLEGRYPDLDRASPTWEEAMTDFNQAKETRSWLAQQLT
jgi:HEPN domain-containing protein